MDSQARWLSVLGKLRVNRSQGLAPHKPLLLLVVLEMIGNGELKSPLLKLTPELAFRFSPFGTIVAHRRTQRMDIRRCVVRWDERGTSAPGCCGHWQSSAIPCGPPRFLLRLLLSTDRLQSTSGGVRGKVPMGTGHDSVTPHIAGSA